MHGVRLGDEPFHALCCRWRQGSIIHRHNAIVRTLMGGLRRISGVRVTEAEPNAQDPLRPNARADIRVTVDGEMMLLDVGVVCPATSHYVKSKHTDTVPGAAAVAGQDVKRKKYARTRTKVHPFIVETGGRLGEEAVQLIDQLGGRSQADKTARARLFREVGQTLVHEQLYMMTNLVAQLAERRERWRRELGAQAPVPPRAGDVGFEAAGRAAAEAAREEAVRRAAAVAELAAGGGAGGAGAGRRGGNARGIQGKQRRPDSQPPPFPGKSRFEYQGEQYVAVKGQCGGWHWRTVHWRDVKAGRSGVGLEADTSSESDWRKAYVWEEFEEEDEGEEEEEEEDEDEEEKEKKKKKKKKDDDSQKDDKKDDKNLNTDAEVIQGGSGN